MRLAGQPAAAARGPDRVDVLAASKDGRLWHRWWDGSRWVPWHEMPDAPAGITAVAASWTGDRLDVYVRAEGRLWYLALRA